MKHLTGAVSDFAAWACLGLFLIVSALALRFAAPLFAYEAALEDMPIVAFVALYMTVTGVVVFTVPSLIRATSGKATQSILMVILLVGLAARLTQFGTPTILEDDYNRYLWDGAVVVSGASPFEHAPLDVQEEQSGSPVLQALGSENSHVLDRVNYPEYRTIYPPVAQAAFALANLVKPFDLDAWRLILLVLELGTVAFIYAILVRLGRSPLGLAVYWWNPLVIKEIANSAHMEPVLMLPVLAAGYFALRGRSVWATAWLAIAAGVKIWPLLTVPALWRQLHRSPRGLISSLCATGVILGLAFWPVLASGLDESSGFIAFARNWQASSAAILLSEWAVSSVTPGQEQAPLMARLILGLVALVAILMICARRAPDQSAVLWRMFLIATTIYLLSPSQTPWYFVWVAPFLCIFPVRGVLLASALLPLHYVYFHFALLDLETIYRNVVVWIIWVPVWTLLVFDMIVSRTRTARVA